ncbi:ABC transporter permease [Acidiphilium sp.]|uniref:ABC transporter permease n=1 Tax=Acidiphilium sp. TaxID=527 RepID=UPI003D003AEA
MSSALRKVPRQTIVNILIQNGVVFGFITLVIVLAFIAPNFVSRANLFSVLTQAAPFILMAVGEMIVVLVAGIDLSVGAVAGFTGACVAILIHSVDLAWPVALIIGLSIALIIGIIQGVVINYLHVTDFIGTLAGLSIISSLTLIITAGNPISISAAGFDAIAQNSALGVPIQIWLTGAVVVIVAIWLAVSATGVHLYAIGGSRIAAFRAGIRVRAMRTLTYGISALCAGIAGIVFASQLGSADPTAGRGDELTAIAAVVIGGVSLFGGVGSIWGVLVGALLISTILDGLVLLNVSPFYTQLVEGVVILLAVMLDYVKRRPS